MDISSTVSSTADALTASGLPVSGQTLFYVLVVMVMVLRLGGVGARPTIDSGSTKRLLKECALEAVSLMTCLALAALLRTRGVGKVAEADAEAWAHIVERWPLLITPDTLLSLQAMLRLVVPLCMVLRARGDATPLSEGATTLWFGANVARLLLLSFSFDYMLDGPLGGILPVAFEIAVTPILAVLSRRVICRSAVTLTGIAAAVAYFSLRNHLDLAGTDYADALFIAAHSLDALAACAYLLRSVLLERSPKDVSAAFAHMVMPVQQGLAAYYFCVFFPEAAAAGAVGLPILALQVGNVVSFGAYFAAAVVYAAGGFDAPHVRGATVTA